MNVDEILKYKRPSTTYYDILGCDQSSSVEQITREYKIRALKLHPDKNPNDTDSLEEFRKLQKAKDVLTDGATRKSYDIWLNSRIHIPFEQWHGKKGHSMHWASPKSMRLGIEEDIERRQGSDSGLMRQTDSESDGGSLVNKFRRYEI